MTFGPESLLPPLVAILLAILTRQVILPLAAGVFVGAILLWRVTEHAHWWHPLKIFWQTIDGSIFDPSHMQALLFSLLLGAMVGVLEHGGGMRALIERISKGIRSRSGAQTLISSAGLAIFFDDYANTLLVGGTMRTTADRFGLSREKLAYLVDSTAAPVAGLSVVSTWAAIEISYMADGLDAGGITDNGAAFTMFIESIPYRFYPWLALVMVFLVSLSGRDFGPMRQAEAEAIEALSLRNSTASQGPKSGERPSNRWLWTAAVVPVLSCLLAVATVLVVTGTRAIGEDIQSQGGLLQQAGQILGSGDAYLALIYGGGTGLVVGVAMHLALGGCSVNTAIRSALGGAWQMMPAMLILWFAWSLSAMTDDKHLDTGGYLSTILSDRLDAWMLPTVVFLISGAVAFSTGTSWGTMAILTPLSITLALRLDDGGPSSAIVLSTCGSVLAGAIFGDHCSPISDTTVLSSRASGCDHLSHVRTQLPYALTVATVCIVAGTIPSARAVSPWICLAIATFALIAIVFKFGRTVVVADGERSSSENESAGVQ